MVISENCCTFIVLNYEVVQTIIAMFFPLVRRRRNTEDKVTEIFFMADEFHKVFCRMLDKYSLNAPENDRKIIQIKMYFRRKYTNFNITLGNYRSQRRLCIVQCLAVLQLQNRLTQSQFSEETATNATFATKQKETQSAYNYIINTCNY